MMETKNFLELPAELLNNILSYLDAGELTAFGQTSRNAHKFISPDNSTLWRQIFLNTYDHPDQGWSSQIPSLRKAHHEAAENWDWFLHLRQRKNLAHQIISDELLDMHDDHSSAAAVLLNIIETANTQPTPAELARGVSLQADDRRSLNLHLLADLSARGQRNLDRIIHARQMKSLAEIPTRGASHRPVTRSTSSVVEQTDLAARLHVLHGLTMMEMTTARLRGISRQLVYDWALTSSLTDYGPYKLDGSGEVNWQVLEGVCSTILRNFAVCADGRILMPTGFHHSIPHRTLPPSAAPTDWAGATGTWIGTYAFLDYADLHSFNVPAQYRSRSTLEDEPEGCGDLMRLDITLNDSLRDDAKLQTSLPTCTDLPMLFFGGRSHVFEGTQRAMISVRGSVSLVPGGREVRWRFIINYGGEDQWQLEGVQPGGIRSGGVYGIWSHCAHAEHGPTGPFCYFPMALCKPSALVRV